MSREIISFPFKPHLARFLFEQLTTSTRSLGYSKLKPMHIDLSSNLGRLIRRLLEKSYKKVKVDQGFTIWVSVPSQVWGNKDMPDGRSSFLSLNEESAEIISELFESMFRQNLTSFIDGGVAATYNKRGIVINQIRLFMQKYKLIEEDLTEEMYRKMYYREKKQSKTLLDKVL